nr:DUF4336 domain-containing protein [Pelagibacterium montanilacus]
MLTRTYRPLNTLKLVCKDIWVVDGPLIEFGTFLARLHFPTRMTIIHVGGGDLFIYSPTPLEPSLRAEIAAIGDPKWIIGPNKIHYWWVPQWQEAYPTAGVYLASGIEERAGDRIDFDHLPLVKRSGYPWDGAIETLPITGGFMTEVEFFHSSSRTLLLTDLIENFEPERLNRWERVLTRLGAVAAPDGQMPRDMRLTFKNQRAELKAAVEQMISWDPERVIIAHGLWFETDGTAELKRAFRWLLG